MKASMDKYITLTKIYLKEYRVHKVSVFFKLVELPLQLILYLFLWKFIARTSPVDYSYMVLYYLLTGLLSLSYPFLSIALDIQDDILEGGIANALVRPYIYVMPYFCKYIAWMCIYSVVYIPVVLYLLVFHNITLIQVLLFVVSSALGMLIEFLTWFAIGLLSFLLRKNQRCSQNHRRSKSHCVRQSHPVVPHAGIPPNPHKALPLPLFQIYPREQPP